MKNSELAQRARTIAGCLTYNDDSAQAAAKHTLLELADRLDTTDVLAHRKADGLLIINGHSKARYATLRERIAYRLFGVLPRSV